MTELKTKPNEASVDSFVAAIPDKGRRNDCLRLVEIMKKVTGAQPKMWGAAILGFGTFHYKGKSREGDWFLCGLASRKKDVTIYVNAYLERYSPILDRLGRFTSARSCLYVKRLSDIDESVLVELLSASCADLASGIGMGC
jgi:hypothetical protein